MLTGIMPNIDEEAKTRGERGEKFDDQITFPVMHRDKMLLRRYAIQHGSNLAQVARDAVLEYIRNHRLEDKA